LAKPGALTQLPKISAPIRPIAGDEARYQRAERQDSHEAACAALTKSRSSIITKKRKQHRQPPDIDEITGSSPDSPPSARRAQAHRVEEFARGFRNSKDATGLRAGHDHHAGRGNRADGEQY